MGRDPRRSGQCSRSLGRDPRAGAPGTIEAVREFWPGNNVQMRARAFYSGRVLVQVFHEQSAEKTI